MKVRPLCPELAEKAQRELNEDPARMEEDLQHMKDWIAKQPHLRARTDDQWLVAFLRGCKYSLERTKEKFDLYYTMRTTAPEFFKFKYNEKAFTDILDLGIVLYLFKLQDVTSPAVLILRYGAYDPNKFNITDIFTTGMSLQEIFFAQNDTYVVAGGNVIMDLQGVGAAHLMQLSSPIFLKKFTVMVQDATPLRMKGVHFINTPPGFESLFNLVKGLLNEKNRNRLYVHNKNYEEMYKHISRDILPAEYGGNGGTVKEIIDHWKEQVKEHSEWLEENYKHGTDESKRPGKPKTAEDLFGLEGSFRQLQFD